MIRCPSEHLEGREGKSHSGMISIQAIDFEIPSRLPQKASREAIRPMLATSLPERCYLRCMDS
jgi:hypothetical protein